MLRISVFGATGSVGASTLDLIRRDRDAYHIVALTGGRNVDALAKLAREFMPEIAVVADADLQDDLSTALDGCGVEAASGRSAIVEAATRPIDWVMSAIVGAAGLEPGLRALEQGATLALANKETLVAAGPLVMATARDNGATILPVDSEHSAVFQALRGEDPASVERVIITASGGAFRDWPAEKLANATVADASKHPNWEMGQRITIDSASMFNKALEVIETREFFGIDPGRIEVLVHPESLVHALVGFSDGALMAHVGPPDMRHAIGHALHWPDRRALPVERLDLAAIGSLSFRAADEARWPALRLAREVMAAGGGAGAIFNAAKEQALDGFIAGRIGFADMATVVETALENLHSISDTASPLGLEAVMVLDQRARQEAQRVMDAFEQ